MRPGETPPQALRRLRIELEQHRRAGGNAHIEHHREALPGVASLLDRVPLVHGVNDPGKFRAAVEGRSLRSGVGLGRYPFASEEYLGLNNVVYTAAGILYPDRQFALVLTPSVEEGRAVDASPWDSGAFYKSLCRHLPSAPASPERRDVFLAHTLPAPEYRSYLIDYVATCFRSGQDYLGSGEPAYPDPLGAICNSLFSSSFEVRFAEPIPLESWSVEMIFVPRDVGDRVALVLRRILEPFHRKKKVHYYDSARRTLQDEARTWLRDQLLRTGGRHA